MTKPIADSWIDFSRRQVVTCAFPRFIEFLMPARSPRDHLSLYTGRQIFRSNAQVVNIDGSVNP